MSRLVYTISHELRTLLLQGERRRNELTRNNKNNTHYTTANVAVVSPKWRAGGVLLDPHRIQSIVPLIANLADEREEAGR